jgi:hypothetical protein
MATEGQQEVARGKTAAGYPWTELRYDVQGTLWRQRHYARTLSPQTCFVVTVQCPQAAADKIFPAADELADSLAQPLHT